MRCLTVEEIEFVGGAYDAYELAADLGVVSGSLWTAAEVVAVYSAGTGWTLSAVLATGAAVTATGAAAVVAYMAHQ